MNSLLVEPTGQGWVQIVELTGALLLSALIGLERELRRKSAGLRTHTLIGFGSASIMLVSKYGFTDVLGEHTVLDPSRVAAQIVSGIGFIGGGLIFVRRDAVRGLTTAAAVWLTTAVGMAAGAGLLVLAAVTTAGYFVIVYAFTPISTRIQRSRPHDQLLEVVYPDGRGLLREVLGCCTGQGWSIAHLSTHHRSPRVVGVAGTRFGHHHAAGEEPEPGTVSVVLELRGPRDVTPLTAVLTEIPGVLGVQSLPPDFLDGA